MRTLWYLLELELLSTDLLASNCARINAVCWLKRLQRPCSAQFHVKSPTHTVHVYSTVRLILTLRGGVMWYETEPDKAHTYTQLQTQLRCWVTGELWSRLLCSDFFLLFFRLLRIASLQDQSAPRHIQTSGSFKKARMSQTSPNIAVPVSQDVDKKAWDLRTNAGCLTHVNKSGRYLSAPPVLRQRKRKNCAGLQDDSFVNIVDFLVGIPPEATFHFPVC